MTTSELPLGALVRGRYEVLGKIGSGGMADVYRARHVAFDEPRALKVVSPKLLEDPEFVQRFRHEAAVARKLQHPNAVRVDDLDTTEDGRPFIVMELLEGRTLRELVHEEGPLPVARALELTRQAALALQAAHDLGIVHRDVKPDNLMALPQPDGTEIVKVADFGIARAREGLLASGVGYAATQTGVVVGTPQYLAPEQATGRREDVDGRADLYALGVTLYELLTGRLPFEADTGVAMMMHHIQTPPRPPQLLRPDLPAGVSALLLRALQKDPTRRFQSGAELAAALQALIASPPTLPGILRPGVPTRAAASITDARTGPLQRQGVPSPRSGPPRRSVPPPPEAPRWGPRALLVGAVLGAAALIWQGRPQGAGGPPQTSSPPAASSPAPTGQDVAPPPAAVEPAPNPPPVGETEPGSAAEIALSDEVRPVARPGLPRQGRFLVMKRAREAARRGETHEARRLLNDWVGANPDDAEARRMLQDLDRWPRRARP